MNEELTRALELMIKHLNETFGNENITYTYSVLRVRVRILEKIYGQTCCYGFIDFQGNILKADGWNQPAKHIRGNLFSNNWKNSFQKHSVIYLTR